MLSRVGHGERNPTALGYVFPIILIEFILCGFAP